MQLWADTKDIIHCSPLDISAEFFFMMCPCYCTKWYVGLKFHFHLKIALRTLLWKLLNIKLFQGYIWEVWMWAHTLMWWLWLVVPICLTSLFLISYLSFNWKKCKKEKIWSKSTRHLRNSLEECGYAWMWTLAIEALWSSWLFLQQKHTSHCLPVASGGIYERAEGKLSFTGDLNSRTSSTHFSLFWGMLGIKQTLGRNYFAYFFVLNKNGANKPSAISKLFQTI